MKLPDINQLTLEVLGESYLGLVEYHYKSFVFCIKNDYRNWFEIRLYYLSPKNTCERYIPYHPGTYIRKGLFKIVISKRLANMYANTAVEILKGSQAAIQSLHDGYYSMSVAANYPGSHYSKYMKEHAIEPDDFRGMLYEKMLENGMIENPLVQNPVESALHKEILVQGLKGIKTIFFEFVSICYLPNHASDIAWKFYDYGQALVAKTPFLEVEKGEILTDYRFREILKNVMGFNIIQENYNF